MVTSVPKTLARKTCATSPALSPIPVNISWSKIKLNSPALFRRSRSISIIPSTCLISSMTRVESSSSLSISSPIILISTGAPTGGPAVISSIVICASVIFLNSSLNSFVRSVDDFSLSFSRFTNKEATSSPLDPLPKFRLMPLPIFAI